MLVRKRTRYSLIFDDWEFVLGWKGLNATFGAQFAVLPLIKSVFSFARTVLTVVILSLLNLSTNISGLVSLEPSSGGITRAYIMFQHYSRTSMRDNLSPEWPSPKSNDIAP